MELRNVAVNRGALSSGTIARMKRSPMFLGVRRVKNNRDSKKEASAEELDEEEWDSQYDRMAYGCAGSSGDRIRQKVVF